MQNNNMNKPQNGLEKNPYIMQNQMQNGQNNQVNPYYNASQNNAQSIPGNNSSFDTGNFLKGALIGAIGAYLLTNEDAQKKIFKTFAQGTDMFSAGIEEMKERIEDAKAELEAQREAK